MPPCAECSTAFTITDFDRELYGRLQVPDPVICSLCSERLRFSFRNERHFYKRRSDLSGTDIITIYAPDTPYKVYHREEWFSDQYDPATHGRDIDFQRPFFEQLYDLSLAVPYEHMVIINSVNSDYCNFIVNSKNCYMSMRIDAEDVSYCYLAFGKSKDCIDCHTINACELCYECLDCTHCYASRSLQRSKQCSDCAYCIDCVGCKHCFGCSGLRQKEHHFFNEPLTKEDYTRRLEEYRLQSHAGAEKATEALRSLDLTLPHRPAIIDQSENVSGDYIVRSKNVHRSFDVEQCEDAADCAGIEFSKDCTRSCFCYYGELAYEHVSCTPSHMLRFSYGAYDSHDVEYCMMTHNGTHDCFGCIGLKHNAFMVLNKQYTEEEYRRMRENVIGHMKRTGEYGRFFPPKLAHFAYNETVAQEFYPLTKEEALLLGYRWRDVLDESTTTKQRVLRAAELPDVIDDVTDDILQAAIACERSGRLFRITKKELDFYHSQRIPLPRLHPDERHYARMRLRNPRILHDRKCQKCGKAIQTTYSPERPEIVYCEECYIQTIY